MLVLRYVSKIKGIVFKQQGKVDFKIGRTAWFEYSVVMSWQEVKSYFSSGLNLMERVRKYFSCTATAMPLSGVLHGAAVPLHVLQYTACIPTHLWCRSHSSPVVIRNYTAMIPLLNTVHKSQSIHMKNPTN